MARRQLSAVATLTCQYANRNNWLSLAADWVNDNIRLCTPYDDSGDIGWGSRSTMFAKPFMLTADRY